MATDKRVAEQRLEDLLMMLSGDRRHLEAYRNKGDASGVARFKGILKLDYALIREHCAEHGLDLPHDVPSEAHPAASDTD